MLRWFTDRSGRCAAGVRIVSVPLFVYRGAMLAWALWIVLSLLSWLRWGWGSFTRGGGWKKGPPRPPRPQQGYGMPYYAPPQQQASARAPEAPQEVQPAAAAEVAPAPTAGSGGTREEG